MSRLALVALTSFALSLSACAEKPGAKKDDKKDAKDDKDAKSRAGKADADAKTEAAKTEEAKPEAKPGE